MNRLTSLVRRYPVASIAVVVAVAVGGFVLLTTRPQPQPPTGSAIVTPSPAAAPATPAPTAQPTPAPAPTPVVAPPPPPPQAAGRADPFAPLVRVQTGGAPPPPANLPPPPPLPPPLFPGPASPGAPGAVPSPAPARLSSGAQLIGVLGDTGKVAIIKIGNEVFIVAQGEMIQNKIRVDVVDANAGLVVLIEEGERIELRFG